MGYGAKAMQLLQHYYEGKFPSLKEDSLPVPVGAKEDSATPDGENLRSEKIAPRKVNSMVRARIMLKKNIAN
jgi:hypothetical protein